MNSNVGLLKKIYTKTMEKLDDNLIFISEKEELNHKHLHKKR